jgi:hypothetical protein
MAEEEDDLAALFAALDPRIQAELSKSEALGRLMNEPPPAAPAPPPTVAKPAPGPAPAPASRPVRPSSPRMVSYPDDCFVPITVGTAPSAPTDRP